MSHDEVRVLATCSLGLGFSGKGLEAGLELEPHAIACDAGSSDFGPYYLGTGLVQKSRRSLKRDMSLLIEGARKLGVPFLTGSAGGAGGAPHLAGTVDLAVEIAREKSLRFRMARIDAEVAPEWLARKVDEGRVRAVGAVPPLTKDRISRLARAVAMMGEEPYLEALERKADVIIGGRSTDPSIFVGVPLRAGIPADVAWHAAKSIDKGYLATTRPQDGSPVLARLRRDHFVLEPTREGSRCTVNSVASLTLHENPDPFEVAQPTGIIDTRDAVYEQLDARCVKVSGSRYRPSKPSLKIEGAELVGYRTILIAGIRDPRLIARLDEFLAAYRALLERTAKSLGIAPSDYSLQFRSYGQDAVMGAREPLRAHPAHEVGLIVDLVGKTEEISAAMGTRLGPTGSRLDITGKLGGGGNFAYPFSPSLIKVGPVYQWSVWHVVDVEPRELRDLFTIRYAEC